MAYVMCRCRLAMYLLPDGVTYTCERCDSPDLMALVEADEPA